MYCYPFVFAQIRENEASCMKNTINTFFNVIISVNCRPVAGCSGGASDNNKDQAQIKGRHQIKRINFDVYYQAFP